MRPTLRTSCLLLATCLLTGPAEADELPRLEDYAFGFPVETQSEAEYYEIEVPLALYRTAIDSRLRDLAVYDSLGAAVPRFLEAPGPLPERPEERIAIPVFALEPNQPTNADALRVLLETGDRTTRLEVESLPPVDTEGRPETYILDLRDEARNLAAIEFAWPTLDVSFVGRIRIEGSDDLTAWTTMGRGAVAGLSGSEARVLVNRVALAGGHYDYLRLSTTDLPTDWRLRSAEGVVRGEADPVARQWLELDGEFVEGEGLVFETAAAPFVDRLELDLPGDNVVVRARIDAGTDDGNWRPLHTGTFYHWRRGGESITGPTVPVNGVRSRRWRVVIEKGSPDLVIGLRLGWRPDTLAFVAQGTAPYTVAAGRGDAPAEGFPQASAFAHSELLEVTRETGRGSPARLGERYELAGSSSLEASRSIPWTQVALWVTLLAGVGLVGWIAVRLLRQLDSTR